MRKIHLLLLLALLFSSAGCHKDQFAKRQYTIGRYGDQISGPAKVKPMDAGSATMRTKAGGEGLSVIPSPAALTEELAADVKSGPALHLPKRPFVQEAAQFISFVKKQPRTVDPDILPIQQEPAPEPELLAIISFALACSSVFLMMLPLVGILALLTIPASIVLSIMSLTRFRRNPGKYSLKGLAIAALSISGCLVLLMMLLIAFIAAALMSI